MGFSEVKVPEKPILQGFRRSVTSAKVHYIPDVSGYAAKLKIMRPQSMSVRVRPPAPLISKHNGFMYKKRPLTRSFLVYLHHFNVKVNVYKYIFFILL